MIWLAASPRRALLRQWQNLSTCFLWRSTFTNPALKLQPTSPAAIFEEPLHPPTSERGGNFGFVIGSENLSYSSGIILKAHPETKVPSSFGGWGVKRFFKDC